MRRDGPLNYRLVALYTFATASLLWIPVLNVLQAEACAAIATLAFFAAGLDAVSMLQHGGYRVREVIVRQWLYLLVPFAIYQIARLWFPGCDFAASVQFYLLFPVVSVVLAVALAFLLTRILKRRVRLGFVLVGVIIGTVPVMYDLALHPQFYVYNHVFGGVLGPIYDLELAIRPGLVRFRVLTLLWAALAILAGHRIRESVRGGLTGGIILVVAISAFYVFPGRLGINTTYDQLARALRSEYKTDHFVIHYDSSSISSVEIKHLAADHEFRYHQLADRLGFDAELPVHSYLYASPAIRAELTGAGYTNVAPVWLGRPQMHILMESYRQSFAHELAHVFSREIGMPVINTSLRVGLVEGFAVAMDPPLGLPSPDDQVASLIGTPNRLGIYHRTSVADAVAASLSPFGFWTSRGAVSYTTMGSFVGFLINEHGISAFERVYQMEDFVSVYGQSVRVLAGIWEKRLLEREVAPPVLDLATARFSVPSLFERNCPHDIPGSYLAFREGQEALAVGDSAAALNLFDEALQDAPQFSDALDAWAALTLAGGDYGSVTRRIGAVWQDEYARTSQLSVEFGDAFALLGRPVHAITIYESGLESSSIFARSGRAMFRLRILMADRPDILRHIVSSRGPQHKAELLSQADDSTGAAAVVAALLFAEAEQYAKAADQLVEIFGAPAAESIGERYPAWLAGFSFRAGRFADAERFRRLAVEAAQSVGDAYQVNRLEDFGKRIEWTMNVGDE